jgi:hypothetical protein
LGFLGIKNILEDSMEFLGIKNIFGFLVVSWNKKIFRVP